MDSGPAGLGGGGYDGRHRSTGMNRSTARTAAAAALFAVPTGGVAAAVIATDLGGDQTQALKTNLAASASPLGSGASMNLYQPVEAGTLQAAASPMSGQQIVESQKTPVPEQVIQDPNAPAGTRTVVDPGAEGARSVIWRVTYDNGREVGRERIGAGSSTPAKPRVVKVGSKKAEAPKPPAAAKKAAAPAAAGGAVWDKIAECESGGDWSTNSGNGYYGGLQFDTKTWNAYGGDQFAPRPDQASREEQIAVANKIKDDRGGYSAWPNCGKKAG